MEYLTPEEFAEKMKVARRTVYYWLKIGRIEGKKIGPHERSMWRIPWSEVKRLLGED